MREDLAEMDFQRFWRRLQQLGLNAYESRSYLVLLGHPKFKALELAARAHVPRQKIYEVLDSLVEKGFAQVVQEKTKLFSAVEPSLDAGHPDACYTPAWDNGTTVMRHGNGLNMSFADGHVKFVEWNELRSPKYCLRRDHGG